MRIAKILLVSTLLAPASCIANAGSDDTARAAEITMRSLMAAWENGDRALIEDLFWPEATYDDFPNQHTYQGTAEIVGYMLAVHDWADDVYWNVGQIHIADGWAVAEWVFSGVQARPIGSDVPLASGAEVLTNGVTIIQMEGDRIIRAADYMDTAPMMLQMGGRLEMPGGSSIAGSDGR